jgi:hypothetical protein
VPTSRRTVIWKEHMTWQHLCGRKSSTMAPANCVDSTGKSRNFKFLLFLLLHLLLLLLFLPLIPSPSRWKPTDSMYTWFHLHSPSHLTTLRPFPSVHTHVQHWSNCVCQKEDFTLPCYPLHLSFYHLTYTRGRERKKERKKERKTMKPFWNEHTLPWHSQTLDSPLIAF